MSGFIAMQREALEHPLFRGNPERFYAWFWLVARAAWKPTPFDIGGKIIALQRGQVCVSVRQLGEAWGMSKSAAERFIARLKTETMIETEAGQGRLVITICNYAKYQDGEKIKRDSSGTATETVAGQQRDIKEPLNHLTIEEPKGSLCPKRVPLSRGTKLPDDWQPELTTSVRPIVDGWPPGRLEHELSAFRDHAADKGRTSKDWQAAFRTWIKNAEKWQTGAKPHAPQHGRPTQSPTANAVQRAIASGRSTASRSADGQSERYSRIGPVPDPVRAIGHERR